MLLCLVVLSAGSVFAADNGTTAVAASDDMAIGENVLTVAEEATVPESVSADSGDVLAEGEGNVVTEENFFGFFDDSGELLDNVTSDELIFSGDFSNVGVNYLMLNRPIVCVGDDATFNGVTFMIMSDNVRVDGFSITQDNDMYGILIQDGLDGVDIFNNFIDYTDLEGFDCYGIYAQAVTNLRLINNTILYTGNTDGTVVNNAVRIQGFDDKDNDYYDAEPASGIIVQGNNFTIAMPSVNVGYDEQTWEARQWSEGIVFYFCEDLEFVDNRVNINYNTYTGASDTLYGVSVRSDAYTFGEVQSSDILIANNTIDAMGHNYMYALYVCADMFEITGNNITSSSDYHYANGISVDGPSNIGEVSKNFIEVYAPDATYGIYSYQYMGEISDMSYIDNTIEVNGYLGAAMELVECNPDVTGNNITANGNYTYGILASIRDEGTISGNKVYALGSNTGTDPTGDPLMPNYSMAISVKGSSVIEKNTVYSTDVGINIVEEGGIEINNNTVTVEANALIDSYGIYAKGVDDLSFIGNTITYVGMSNGTIVNNAVRIEGKDKAATPATHIVFDDNTFDITLPSVDVVYDWTTYEATVYSEGIVFYYCDGVQFVDNDVDVRYSTHSSAWGNADSIYAVSARGNAYDFDNEIVCSNIVIANNTINVEGYDCAYPITIDAQGFEISGNNITSSSEAYLAHGIDVNGPSSNGIVANNNIIANAPDAVYGIYSYEMNGAIDGMTYANNTIEATAYAVAGMEVAERNAIVADNNITANGNYTYGIIVSVRDDDITVSRNNIYALGSNVGTDAPGDSFMTKNSVGIAVKGDSLIEDNTVYSTNDGLMIVEKGGVEVNDNTFTVEANALIDSYGIYAKGVNDLSFAGNTITFVGNTDGTVVNNAVRIEGKDKAATPTPADHIVFDDNTFDITLPSVDVVYDWDTYEATVYSEGIVFYYCNDVQFVDNDVDVRYSTHTSAYGDYDSIYGVSVRSNGYVNDEDGQGDIVFPIVSTHALIADNTITVNGYGCVYGVTVEADGFEVSGNTITAIADGHLAHGIDVNGPSGNGDISDNTITVESPNASYGIYSYEMMDYSTGVIFPIVGVEYNNNTIDVTGYASAGMEIAESNPYITDNTVTANGNYTYGIISSVKDVSAVITGNTVYALGSNVGDEGTGDGIMTKNSVGISDKGKALIENNTVHSTDVGINLAIEGIFTVNNNTIFVMSNTEDIDNHAIVAKDIDGYVVVTNNDITYVGATAPKDNYTAAKAYGLYFVNTLVDIADNTMHITLPSLPADWEEVPPGSWNYVRHSYNEGIVLDNCSVVQIFRNNITVNYDGGSYGSIYAVDVLDCNDVFMENNTITANGENYLYGIIIQSPNFVIANNTVYAISDYYANCIDVEGPSAGAILSNTLASIAPEDAYPIYAGMNGQPVTLIIQENEIYGQAYYGVGVEIGGTDAEITDNTIVLKGNHTIGIGADVDDLLVTGNTIISNATNTGDIAIWDSMGSDTTGIKSKRGTVNITGNYISSTGEYSVVIPDGDGTVTENYLVAKSVRGDSSVNATYADVYNNTPFDTVLYVPDVIKFYNEPGYVEAFLTDVNGDPVSGVNVKITVGSLAKTLKTDDGGYVALDITDLEPGEYKVSAKSATVELYNRATATASVIVSDGKINTTLTVPDVAIYNGENPYVVATLKDIYGNAISGVNVKVTVGSLAKTMKTDDNGQVALDISNLEEGRYKVTAKSASTSFYNWAPQVSAVAYVADDKIDTTLTVPDVAIYNGENPYVVATLKDSYGKAVSGVNVKVTVGSLAKTIKTDENGQVALDISNLEEGCYKVTAKSASSAVYNWAPQVTATAYVADDKINTTLAVDNVATIAGSGSVVATLKDSYGNAVKGVNVKVTVGSLAKTLKTDENGQVSLDISDLEPGNYTVTAKSASSAVYNWAPQAKATAIVCEDKIGTVLSADDLVTVHNSGDKLVATLKDVAGNAVKGLNVKISVGSLAKTLKTDANGQVALDVSTLDPGSYTATIKSGSSSTYSNAAQIKANVTVYES